ncbi:MAG: TIGR02757 family protein [Desulfomonile tiedjei]|nr:TIGR02757 family protein [Desulfomonile tiedjei]
MPARACKERLSELYRTYNRREFVHPDPLEFLYDYEDLHDREIVGLIASCLAYGNVRQILKSVKSVLDRMESPQSFLEKKSKELLIDTFKDFKHRFTTGLELATMLYGVKRVVERHGSLCSCFAKSLREEDETIVPALCVFVKELSAVFDGRPRSLLPSPEAGSACKRFNLFMRWMVRKDAVDPGGWDCVPASKLVVPLDVHMYRISSALGFTKRKQADLRTAFEITAAFRQIAPEDPVRYDFCLTRLGIRDDLSPADFLESCKLAPGSPT